jgi:hypothetical protein
VSQKGGLLKCGALCQIVVSGMKDLCVSYIITCNAN